MKKFLRALVRLLFKPLLSPRVPLAIQRQGSRAAGLLSKFPPGTQPTRIDMNGVPGRRYRTHSSQNGRALLFLHGGAYVLGGPASHGALAARLGDAAGATTYFADYSLAPEHPYPAATEDALTAYRWLLRQYSAERIVIAGDSAGGNLTLATAMIIRDKGLPMPAALALISPWIDLSHSGESARSLAQRDPMLRTDWLAACARLYAPNVAPEHPCISPLFGEMKGLPPMLIHVGSEEIVLSDSERLLERARAAGVEVQLQVFEGMWHDFQLHAGQVPEADESIAGLGRFMRERSQAVAAQPLPVAAAAVKPAAAPENQPPGRGLESPAAGPDPAKFFSVKLSRPMWTTLEKMYQREPPMAGTDEAGTVTYSTAHALAKRGLAVFVDRSGEEGTRQQTGGRHMPEFRMELTDLGRSYCRHRLEQADGKSLH